MIQNDFTRIMKIDKFPVILFKQLDKHEEEECTICKQKFIEDAEIRLLECKHFYHKNCIDEWFQTSQFCCICKKDYSLQANFVIVSNGVDENYIQNPGAELAVLNQIPNSATK